MLRQCEYVVVKKEDGKIVDRFSSPHLEAISETKKKAKRRGWDLRRVNVVKMDYQNYNIRKL